MHLVQSAKTMKEAWESLKAEYRSVNMMRVTHLKSNILGYKFINGYKMANWRDNIQWMYQQLHDVDLQHLIWQWIHASSSDNDANQRSLEIPPLRVIKQSLQCSTWHPTLFRDPWEAYRWRQRNSSFQWQASVIMTAQTKFLQSKPSSKCSWDAEVNQSMPATAPTNKHAHTSSKLQCTNPHCPNLRSHHTIDNCFAFGVGKCGNYPPW